MKFVGKAVGGVRMDLDTKTAEVTLQCPAHLAGEWGKLKGLERLSVSIGPYRRRRSLDANAYYWQLLSQLADALGISKPHLHNLLLRRYGQPEAIDGQTVYLVLPDSDSGARAADEAETFHIRPTSQVKTGPDGTRYRTYTMLRGSSTYDTKEMSTLIDGLVSECREQGIETMPPEEMERMMAAYARRRGEADEEAEKRADG